MDQNLSKLAQELYSKGNASKSKFLTEVADKLRKSHRSRAEVNVSQLSHNCDSGETVLVPGKVLGSGLIDKKLTVAAWAFSKDANSKITKAGGKIITIEELVKENPKGTKVRLMI